MTTRDALAAALERAGFDPDTAVSRAALTRRAATRLARVTTRPPYGAWVVPGRIEVIGKHTDYAGGRSLVGAAPRGLAVVAAPREDGRVRVLDAARGGRIELDPTEHDRSFSGWTRYVAVVARRLALNFPGASLGADIAIAGDLPSAAGLSSSSALVVGVARALVARGRLDERLDWAAAIGTPADLAAYLGAVENGSSFRSLPGAAGAGTEGGCEDHVAILLSRPDRLAVFRYLPIRRVGDVSMSEAWQFVLMTSGVHAGKAGDARDRYNRASRAARALVHLWRRAVGDDRPSLGAVLESDPGAVNELRRLAAADGGPEFTGADLVRRLAHFVGEDARVSEMLVAFERADLAAIGALAAASQRAADIDLGNQVPETRALVEAALVSGAPAASSFGAGFGGSVWALVEASADDARRFAAEWSRAYRAACPHAGRVVWFAARPSPGLTSCEL